MVRKSLQVGIAAVLTVGVAWVIVDGLRRASTVSVLLNDLGNPARATVQAAEWNLVYVLGLATGAVTGLAAAVAGVLWWKLLGRRLEHWLLRRRPASPVLQVADDSVVLSVAGQEAARFRWEEVQEAVSFKVDCLVYDDIRLAFRLPDGWLEVSEDTEGWSALTEAMERHLPGIPAGWYAEVMTPPFETNYRVLFKRG